MDRSDRISPNALGHLENGDDEAELRLTRPVVERLGDVHAESGRVTIRVRGEWMAVRLDTDSDMALVVSPASVASTTASSASRASSS